MANIMLGSYGVGSINVDASQVRGAGSPINPHLVAPIIVELNARPIDQQLAITRLWCTLNLDKSSDASTQIGPPIPVLTNRAFVATSPPPSGDRKELEHLRFPIPLAALHFIEERRLTTPNHEFVANLLFRATIVWVSGSGNTIEELQGTEPRTIPNNPFASMMNMGMLYTIAPLHEVRIDPLQVRVPASIWVTNVLPGLGYARVRLIELVLPRANDVVPEDVIKNLDEAFSLYDAGQYRDAITRCRQARTDLERSLGASREYPIADVVIEKSGLTKDDPRYDFLLKAWSTYSYLTNAGPHKEGEYLNRHDALLCIEMTAIFVEYLGGLLG